MKRTGAGTYTIDSSTYATETYVDTAVSGLVDSAPAALDTLNELASALGDDANFSTTVSNSIGTKWTEDTTKISNWDTAYSWGDHSTQGYLTSYTETDPVFSAHAASGVTTAKISNWDTAYSWGDHSTEGYLTTHQDISGKANLSGATFTGNVNIGLPPSGTQSLTVAGNIIANGTVDGVDIAARDAVLTSTTTTANSAMQDLVDDTTPQLGGDLDLNGNDITGTGTVDGRDVATDGARLDQAKKIPFSLVTSATMVGSSPNTIINLQIPATTVPSQQAIDCSFAVRRYNGSSSLKKSSTYQVYFQLMSKGSTGISLGTATYSSSPASYHAWYYVSGDKTHLIGNKRGKFATSSTGSNSSDLQGLYYDDVNNRTYFRISRYPNFNTVYDNVEVFYSMSGFLSAGTYVTQTGSKVRYNSLEPVSFTSQSISMQEILPETTSRSYVRLQFDAVSSIASIQTYVEDLSGHVENLL